MKKRIFLIMLVMCIISIFSFGAQAETTDRPEANVPDDGDEPFTLEAPQNLTAELKYDQDNIPYFEIKLDIPQSVKDIDAKLIEDSEYFKGKSCEPIEIQVDTSTRIMTGTKGLHFTGAPVFLLKIFCGMEFMNTVLLKKLMMPVRLTLRKKYIRSVHTFTRFGDMKVTG